MAHSIHPCLDPGPLDWGPAEVEAELGFLQREREEGWEKNGVSVNWIIWPGLDVLPTHTYLSAGMDPSEQLLHSLSDCLQVPAVE